MEGRPDAGTAKSDLSRIGTRHRDIFLGGASLHAGSHDKCERHTDDQTHRGEILEDVVGHIPEQGRVGHVGRPDGQAGVAVRGLFGDVLDAQAAVGADTVLDQDRLAERQAQRLGEGTHEVIGSAAWRQRHYDPDRTAWPSLSRRTPGLHAQHGQEHENPCDQLAPRRHPCSHPLCHESSFEIVTGRMRYIPGRCWPIALFSISRLLLQPVPWTDPTREGAPRRSTPGGTW